MSEKEPTTNDEQTNKTTSGGGNVNVSGEFSTKLESFVKTNFQTHKQKQMEACRFAMAIGIQLNKRMKREDWKKNRPKDKNIGAWSNFCNGHDFGVMFDSLGLGDSESHSRIAEEFIGGGLRWLDSKGILDQDNMTVLQDVPELSHLFSDMKSNETSTEEE